MIAQNPEQDALVRLLQIQPAWCGLATAQEAIGLPPLTLLHAGPPISNLQTLAKPLHNAAILAILYEGWADSIAAAEHLLQSNQVKLQPAQNHRVVTPLAAVVSPTMQLQIVRHGPHVAYSPLNGGQSPALRFGTLNLEIVDRLRWLNHQLGPALAQVPEPIPLIPLAAQSLKAGEECHSCTQAGTQALRSQLQPHLQAACYSEALEFLQNSPGFFLNLWMAACKCILQAAEGAGGSLVTAMAGNGCEFGLQLSGLPGQWITVPAQPPRQSQAYPSSESLALHPCGAIGDSAVVDALGFGGMALSYAPNLATELQAALPPDALQLPPRLLLAEHPGFSSSRPLVGLSAQQVLATSTAPLVNLAILDREGQQGILGKGVYRPPLELFKQAVEQLANGTRPQPDL